MRGSSTSIPISRFMPSRCAFTSPSGTIQRGSTISVVSVRIINAWIWLNASTRVFWRRRQRLNNSCRRKKRSIRVTIFFAGISSSTMISRSAGGRSKRGFSRNWPSQSSNSSLSDQSAIYFKLRYLSIRQKLSFLGRLSLPSLLIFQLFL